MQQIYHQHQKYNPACGLLTFEEIIEYGRDTPAEGEGGLAIIRQ